MVDSLNRIRMILNIYSVEDLTVISVTGSGTALHLHMIPWSAKVVVALDVGGAHAKTVMIAASFWHLVIESLYDLPLSQYFLKEIIERNHCTLV